MASPEEDLKELALSFVHHQSDIGKLARAYLEVKQKLDAFTQKPPTSFKNGVLVWYDSKDHS